MINLDRLTREAIERWAQRTWTDAVRDRRRLQVIRSNRPDFDFVESVTAGMPA